MNDIPECDDSMVLKLVAHCHTLRHISFMGTSKLTDRAFKYLAMENRKLRSIKIESKQLNPYIKKRSHKIMEYCYDR